MMSLSLATPHDMAVVLRLLESRDLPAAARLAAASASSSPLPLAAVLLHRPLPPRLGYGLHARAARAGPLADRYLANALLAFYIRLLDHLPHALRAFDDLPRRDVVAHCSVLAAFLRVGLPRHALVQLRTMAAAGYGADDDVAPSAHALSASSKACAVLHDLRAGACVHGTAVVRGYGDDGVVLNALVDMYGATRACALAMAAKTELAPLHGLACTYNTSRVARQQLAC